MTVPAIKIEKNVPLPIRVRRGGRKTLYPWDVMDVNDSFVFPKTTKKATASSLAYRTGKISGKKFAIRDVAEGIRCWRLA